MHVIYIYINWPLELLYLLKKPHQNPIGSVKDLSMHRGSEKQLGFICFDYNEILLSTVPLGDRQEVTR
jgi:hypothetical protein